MALAEKFKASLTGPEKLYDFILAEDESDTTEGSWIGLRLATDRDGIPLVREERAPVLGARISEGHTQVEDRDPLSHLVWRQDNWEGGALVPNADKKNDGYQTGTFDAAWGSLAPGIAKNFGSDRGNTRQPIGWLLRNPHFESDADDGWSDDSSSSGTVDMQSTNDARSDILGNQSCEIIWTGTSADVAIISQSLTNPAVYQGLEITVHCYLKLTAGSGGVHITISDGVGSTDGTGVTSAADWTLVTCTRTIDASATEVTITLETEDTSTFTGYVDDFTVYSGATTLDPVGVVVTDNGDVYTAAGRIVAKLNVGTTDQFRWDAVYIHASAVATDIVVYYDTGTPSTKVYVAFGASAAYIYGTGTSWTASTITSTGKNAIYFTVSRNTLWKSESANTIKSSTAPLNGGSWSSVYTIGDANRAITKLYGYNDTVWVGKEDGIHRYRRVYEDGTSADLFENVTSEFATQPNERHFKGGSEFVDGFLYLPLGRGGMMRTNGAALQDISHVFTKPAAGINGVVYSVAQDTKNLWLFVDNSLISLIYTEDGKMTPHTRGDQPSVSPSALAPSALTVVNTGFTNPGTVAQDDDADASWSNLSNVTSSDNSRASNGAMTWTQESDLLKVSNFSFTIPTTAEIVGVEVTVEARTPTGGLLHTATTAQLIKGGSVTGNNKSGATWSSSTDATNTFGGSSDLWGVTLTPADINATNFGFAFRIKNDSGTTNTGFDVDHIAIKVYYTEQPSSSRVLLPKAAAVVTWNVSSIETPHLLGVYGGQEPADSKPYLITDCWALPDEGVAPVLDSSDTPASPTTHQWYSSRWSANAPTELKVASHLTLKFKDMTAEQPVTVKFGTDGASPDSVSLGTFNSSDAVQDLYFGSVTNAQEATLYNDIALYFEGTYTGSSNKRQIVAFELHSWLVTEILKTWQIGVRIHGVTLGNGQDSPFGPSETISRLEQYEDPGQSPQWFYLIEDFDGDAEPSSTPVTFRPGTTVKQIAPVTGDGPETHQVWNIVLQRSHNFE